MIKKLFSDDKGNPSLGRIMFFMSFLVGCILAFLHHDATVVAIFVGSSALGKTIQKFGER